ncbi:MAG: hypothetical protein KDC35_06030 [Acidobacteria bacterium]|nr:hypothetical protein [Acidobacteriota bacterium]
MTLSQLDYELELDFVVGKLTLAPGAFAYPFQVRRKKEKTIMDWFKDGTGDKRLDQLYTFKGPGMHTILAYLTRRMRAVMLLEQVSFRMKGQEISAHVKAFVTLGQAVSALAEIHQNLTSKASVTDRLIDNFLQDPSPRVRQLNLQALGEKSLSHDQAVRLGKCLVSSDEATTKTVIQMMGSTAVPFLIERANASEADYRKRWVLLLAGLSRSHALPYLMEGLSDPETAYAYALTLCQWREVNAIAPVLEVMDAIVDMSDAGPLVEALASWGRPEFEPPLLQIVRDERVALEVRCDAASGLARCGSTQSLEALHRIIEQKPKRKLKSAIEHAIAAVRSRRQGEHGGFISPAEPGEPGAISPLSQGEHGEISSQGRAD